MSMDDIYRVLFAGFIVGVFIGWCLGVIYQINRTAALAKLENGK